MSGDRFAEILDDEATTIHEIVTSRNISTGKRIPMAGVPHHAVENYIARLIAKGYHVAVCEQISDESVKGVIPRDVTRVVTPVESATPSRTLESPPSPRSQPTWDDLREQIR
jgi:DNA mismatch repair protein MutS